MLIKSQSVQLMFMLEILSPLCIHETGETKSTCDGALCVTIKNKYIWSTINSLFLQFHALFNHKFRELHTLSHLQSQKLSSPQGINFVLNGYYIL